jgi:hypothetical protein
VRDVNARRKKEKVRKAIIGRNSMVEKRRFNNGPLAQLIRSFLPDRVEG